MDGHSTPFIATPSSLDGSDHWPTFSDTDRDTPGSFVDVKIEEASSPTEAFDQLCLSADCVFVKEEAAAHVDETASEPPSAGSIIEPIASGSTNKRSGRKLLPASSRRKVYSEQEPYAKLIQRALLSKSDHCMSLQELYQWFREHTDKTKDEDKKGWQNSIRHNLSMNHVSRYHVLVYILFPHLPMSASGSIMTKRARYIGKHG
jgi:hypothetical protein